MYSIWTCITQALLMCTVYIVYMYVYLLVQLSLSHVFLVMFIAGVGSPNNN